ncbi:hypothetical protein HHI36_003942 [Cryptolaemus montrouzieri]|uniref:RNA methyltransferase n=1 Tax=Cryptolaemus montrouzieri TaxID=559131 RepID=A0ABD2NQ04_9CUCU
MEDLKFKGNDPGAVQHGNFINYYNFNPPEERIQQLPKNIWKTDITHCLDIGCNSGDLTVAFHEFLENCGCHNNQILGIDIDPILVKRAKEKFTKIEFHCLNIMSSDGSTFIRCYLEKNNLKKFHVVTCFSITMWIHLNNGDDGLRRFLKHISDLGELIVIEPQPWKCYKTAVKRLRKCNSEFSHFKALELRESIEMDIENFLVTECKRTKIMQSDNTKWGRKLLIFT